MFAEKLLEGRQQFDHVQTAIRADVPALFLIGDHHLGRPSQFARQHFLINAVADAHRGAADDQAEVFNILQVVHPHLAEVAVVLATQQCADDTMHPRFTEFVAQLIQMGGARKNQTLTGLAVIA